MNKIIISKRAPKRDKRTLHIPMKRVRDPEGNIVSMPTLDANDSDFGLKLEAVFRRNVVKAIKENKKAPKAPRRARGKN